MFHVSLLKKKIRDKYVAQTTLPAIDDDGKFLVQPIDVLQRQMVKHNKTNKVNVSIQCSNLPPEMRLGKIMILSQHNFLILSSIFKDKDSLRGRYCHGWTY